jgi:carbon monoxide dehydrogenase subunit G
MIFSGIEHFGCRRVDVWMALHDPEFLKEVIPGCTSMKLQEDGQYVIGLELGVAAIKGKYDGQASIIDIEVPRHYTLLAEGSGAPGFVKIKLDCFLNEFEDDQCKMEWESQVEAGGLIAGIGGRVLSGVAKFIAKQFFQSVRKRLTTYQIQ